MKKTFNRLATLSGVAFVTLLLMGAVATRNRYSGIFYGDGSNLTNIFNSGVVNVAVNGMLTISNYDDTFNDSTLTVIRGATNQAGFPIALMLRNYGDSVGGSDWQNEVYMKFQAGTSADHRRYMQWLDHAGLSQWIMGVNASDIFIQYDGYDLVHRLWFESTNSSQAYFTGNSYICGAGSGGIVIGKDGPNGVNTTGTGGLAVYSGGGASTNVPVFTVQTNAVVSAWPITAPNLTLTNSNGSIIATNGNLSGTGSLIFSNTVYSGLFAVTNFQAGTSGVGVTNSTAEQPVAAWTVPGGAIGSNGVVKVTCRIAGYGNYSNCTYRVYYGATFVAGYSMVTANRSSDYFERQICNANNQAIQISAQLALTTPEDGTSGAAISQTAFDTSANFTLTVKMQDTGLAQTNEIRNIQVEILGHQ